MPQSFSPAYLDTVLRFIESRGVVQQKDLVNEFSDSAFLALDAIERLKQYGFVFAKIAPYRMDKTRRVYAVANVKLTAAGRIYLASKV